MYTFIIWNKQKKSLIFSTKVKRRGKKECSGEDNIWKKYIPILLYYSNCSVCGCVCIYIYNTYSLIKDRFSDWILILSNTLWIRNLTKIYDIEMLKIEGRKITIINCVTKESQRWEQHLHWRPTTSLSNSNNIYSFYA